MNKKMYPWQKNEQGFLILMVVFAIIGMGVVFFSFMTAMIFAVVITCASYPLYQFVLSKVKNESLSSGIVVLTMAFIVLFPLTYVIAVSSSSVYSFYLNNQDAITQMNFSEVERLKNVAVSYLPIDGDKQAYLNNEISENARLIFDHLKNIVVNSSKAIADNSIQVLYFLGLTLFSMYFFYKGGADIVDKVKKITPLDDDFDDLIMSELYSLCGILTVSVFSIAVIQGVAFAFVTYFMDLNWFFIGVAISLASFIPVVGTVLIWLPLAIYLVTKGQTTEAIFIVFWGVVVTGIIIDNVLRPILTGKICNIFNGNSNELDIKDFNPLDNNFIVILSNIGGMLTFGVIGLFFGPIIISISIAVFDLYIERIKAASDAEEAIKDNDKYSHCLYGKSQTLNESTITKNKESKEDSSDLKDNSLIDNKNID